MAGAVKMDGPITEINVTPLVDVCLVLVIIFMVLAPLVMQAGIEVASSKKGAARAITALTKNVNVRLSAQGQVTVNGTAVSWEAFPGAVRTALSLSQDKLVALDASPKADIGKVVEILDESRQNGAEKLALLNSQ